MASDWVRGRVITGRSPFFLLFFIFIFIPRASHLLANAK